MVVQAVLDPVPMQLMANAAPAPSDVVWKNTYLPRSTRMVRSWTVTAFVVVLTVVWSFTLIPIAGLINDKAIGKVAPGFEDFLKDHKVLQSLVTTGLPTLTVSLLNVLVPYLYDCT
jgi:ABC-type sulfate transport system permease component